MAQNTSSWWSQLLLSYLGRFIFHSPKLFIFTNDGFSSSLVALPFDVKSSVRSSVDMIAIAYVTHTEQRDLRKALEASQLHSSGIHWRFTICWVGGNKNEKKKIDFQSFHFLFLLVLCGAEHIAFVVCQLNWTFFFLFSCLPLSVFLLVSRNIFVCMREKPLMYSRLSILIFDQFSLSSSLVSPFFSAVRMLSEIFFCWKIAHWRRRHRGDSNGAST